MPDPRDVDARHAPRLLLAAAIAGMAAIIALPMSALAPAALPVLVFATPALLFVAAAVYGRSWLRPVAVGLAVALVVTLVAGILPIVPTAVVFLGPIAAVVLVGTPLREVDVVAAGSFLGAATVTVIGGFATRGMTGSVALVVLVAVAGLALVAARLGRPG